MQERILIEKAKNGNQRAFKTLFDNNVNVLFRYLRQFSNDRDQVEDWVQRSFIKAFRNIFSFQGKSTFKTWLFRIAINEMRSDFRLISNNRTEEFEENNHSEYDNDDFEWQDEMKWLLSETEDLKKSVFILFEIEGYKHYEIAEMLDISESYSKTTLHRVKKLLKEKWLAEAR